MKGHRLSTRVSTALLLLLAGMAASRPAGAEELDPNRLIALNTAAGAAYELPAGFTVATTLIKEVQDQPIGEPCISICCAKAAAARAGGASGEAPVIDHYQEVTSFVPVYKTP